VAEAHAKVVFKHVEREDGGVARDEVGQLLAPAALLELLVQLLQRHARNAHDRRARLIDLPGSCDVHPVTSPQKLLQRSHNLSVQL